jgi:ATP-dependent HslUV protease ATP-binding subunit HslU
VIDLLKHCNPLLAPPESVKKPTDFFRFLRSSLTATPAYKSITIREARDILTQRFSAHLVSMTSSQSNENQNSLFDLSALRGSSEQSPSIEGMESLESEARRLCEEGGIVFLDEIDKLISAPGARGKSSDPSSEGVQRDLLPLIEGTVVNTVVGNVNTEHILFICAGSFHSAAPKDLMPELQGRLPIKVILTELTPSELRRILWGSEHSLLAQQQALMGVDGLLLNFTEGAVTAIAEAAFKLNKTHQNIGARRLHSVVEQVVEDIGLFEMGGPTKTITVDAEYVANKLKDKLKTPDLYRHLL